MENENEKTALLTQAKAFYFSKAKEHHRRPQPANHLILLFLFFSYDSLAGYGS